MAVRLDDRHVRGFIQPHELEAIQCQVEAAHEVLHQGTGLGNDFLGWLTLPTIMTKRSLPASKKRRKDPFRLGCSDCHWHRRFLFRSPSGY